MKMDCFLFLNGEMDAEAWAAFTEKGFASLREDLASENK